jgi:hypothetical protein
MALLWHLSANAHIGRIPALSEGGLMPRDPQATAKNRQRASVPAFT